MKYTFDDGLRRRRPDARASRRSGPTYRARSGGGRQAGRVRSAGGGAGVLSALGRALSAIASAIGGALRTALAALAALAAWAAPRLRRLNAPLRRSPKRLAELLVIPLALLYFEIALRLFAGSSLLAGAGYALLFTLGYSLLVDFVASFFYGRGYRIVMTSALVLGGRSMPSSRSCTRAFRCT